MYGIVRINSILANNELTEYKITQIQTKEEKDLLIELTKFNDVIKSAYDKKAPHFIAEYVYKLVKKFSAFYSACNINNEVDVDYKKSKLSLIYLTRQFVVKCVELLGIECVERM